jgi:ABC-type antimicrobial peptide transport system permease subunit
LIERSRAIKTASIQEVPSGLVRLAIGVGLALMIMHVLHNLLYGVAATDPITFVGTAALLALAALAAYLLPARRAAKVDPSTALREA